MVDFWASWCIPCREEAPVLAKVYMNCKGKRVEFIGIDIWDKEGDAREDYLRQFGITIKVTLEPIEDGEPPFTCPEFNKVYRTQIGFEIHMETKGHKGTISKSK